MPTDNTRNLAADDFQLIFTSLLNLISFLLLLTSSYVILATNKKRISPYAPILYRSSAFVSEFYWGTVLNTVILIPIPGMYCIGWARNSNDFMKIIHIILAYKLFLLQFEILFIILILKLQTICRNDSAFKLNFFIQCLVISFPLIFNPIAFVIISQSNKHDADLYISEHLPYHGFLHRYEFVWIMTTFKQYMGFAAILLCSLGLIFVLVFLGYVLILYELERQISSLSKQTKKEWKEFIDEIRNHGTIIVIFFCAIVVSGFVQFFVKEETDVSFLVAFAFLIFVSAPIAANVLFLWNDPTYRSNLFSNFPMRNMRRQTNVVRVASRETF